MSLKCRYKRLQMERALDLEEIGENDIFKINWLQAMQWIQEEWESTPCEVIQNCWRHTNTVNLDSLRELLNVTD